MRVERFESIESYAKLVGERQNYSEESGGFGYGSSSWDDGIGFSSAIKLSIHGHPPLVGQTAAAVDSLVTEFQIRQESRKAYISHVSGSRVSVPEYLAGSPFCMKRKAAIQRPERAINIYVCTTCAAAVSAQNMLKRGVTIMALLEYLQLTQVSVELFLTAETHGRTDGDFIQVIKVESNPLDLSTASFAIAHPAFARHVTYTMAKAMDGFNGAWGREHNNSCSGSSSWGVFNPELYLPKISKAVGMSPGDIYIPAPTYNDDEIISHPDMWLSKRIETIRESFST